MDIEKFKKDLARRMDSDISKCESLINGLEFQRERILSINPMEYPQGVSPVHDADFYVVLLRRIYRFIEDKARTDSRVANLKGKNKELFKHVKIRDHFEHGINLDELSPIDTTNIPVGQIKSSKPIKIAMSLFINKEEAKIVSGEWAWDLNESHDKFIEIIEEVLDLHPFNNDVDDSEKALLGRIKEFFKRLKLH